ncbi:hypothetical protein BQ8420_00240 [Nocardiopsis sp. JB363]|nr:hypothetical protein BQ8420_00240 [Nocardiopsis sp. JB363]
MPFGRAWSLIVFSPRAPLRGAPWSLSVRDRSLYNWGWKK